MTSNSFNLKIENLSYQVAGGEILSEINLDVKASQGLLLVGESGRGKSTLIRLLAGLILPSSGKILYSAQDIASQNEKARTEFRKNNVGLAFQNPHIIPSLTARQNIALALNIHGGTDENADRSVQQMMERFEIDHKADAYIDTLSGGEARRVALARAFIAKPKITLLDEPLTGLDRDMAKRVTKEILALKRETKTLLVVATHDMQISDAGNVWLNLDKLGTKDAVTIQDKTPPRPKAKPPAPKPTTKTRTTNAIKSAVKKVTPKSKPKSGDK